QWATAAPVPDWNVRPQNCNPREVWEPGSGVTITPPRCDTLLDRLAVGYFYEFADAATQLLEGPFSLSVLSEQVQSWRDVLAPLVQEDPTIDLDEWNEAVDGLLVGLPMLRRDFAEYVATGLVEEKEVEPAVLPEELNEVTTNGGLHIGGVTNFEFDPSITGVPAGVYLISDDAATVTASWNQLEPLSGEAD